MTFDEVITSFYEAATDASLWMPALASLSDLFGPAFTSHFFTWDRKEVLFSAVGSDHLAKANAAHAQYYSKIDPRVAFADVGPTGAIFICHRHFDDAYVAKSEFYNDFLIPIGGRYIVAAKLIDTGSVSGILSVHRSAKQGPFEEADARLFARVEPHLTQAARLFHKFRELGAARERASAALDRLPWGTVTVDQNAKILETNAIGEAHLRRADVLRVRNGLAECVAEDKTRSLHRLIFDASSAAGGKACIPGGVIRVDRLSGRGCLTILVAPLRQATQMIADPSTTGAILIIADSEQRSIPPAAWLMQLFGLTPAEAAVALSIAAGKMLEEIADLKGVTKNTVRVQTQSILAKTGVRRQAELVRLVLGIPTMR